MVRILDPEAMHGVSGVARYRDAFAAASQALGRCLAAGKLHNVKFHGVIKKNEERGRNSPSGLNRLAPACDSAGNDPPLGWVDEQFQTWGAPMKPFSRTGNLTLVAGMLAATSVHANKIMQDGVDDVSLTLQSSTVEVLLKDFSGGNSLAGVDIKPVTTHLNFPLQSRVKCAKNSGGYSHMDVGFGAFNPTFLDTLVLHSEMNPSAGYTEWSGNKAISQAPGTHHYQVALGALKNPGLPDYQLDPVAELNKAMEQFVSQGGTQVDFLRQDRTLEVQRKLTAMGTCWKGFSGKALGTVHTPVTIRIKYQGNPNLTNVKVAVGQQQGGIQVGYNPLKIVSGEIQPYAPTYVGACPADLKFRVRLKVGGKGGLKYRINEGGSTVYQSPGLDFAGGGEFTHDFTFTVPFEGKQSLGQMKQRTFTLHALGKDAEEAVWPVHYQKYGNKSWNYKCTPQVSVGVGGVGPGGANLAPVPAPVPGGDAPSPGVGGARVKAPTAVPAAPAFAPASGGTSAEPVTPKPKVVTPPATPTVPARVTTPAPAAPPARATSPAPATPPVDRVQGGQAPEPAGLLLPAVQKAREPAAEEPSRTKGNVEYQYKVEEGRK